MSSNPDSENQTRLWRFNDVKGEPTYIRPEDFVALTHEVGTEPNEIDYWAVYSKPDHQFEICDEDATRLAQFLDQFVVNDFSQKETTAQILGRWKSR